MLLPCTFRADMLFCSMLLLNVYLNFMCFCTEAHMLAIDQKFKPAMLKANIPHLISRYRHNMPTVSWSMWNAAHNSEPSSQLFIGFHMSR